MGGQFKQSIGQVNNPDQWGQDQWTEKRQRKVIKGVIIKGVRVNLPRFDAHSLTGTIVPKESEYVDRKKTNLQLGIQTRSG